MSKELVPQTRTDISFFPKPDEAELIRKADAETLAIYIDGNRPLEGAFLHELWRNNRMGDMHAVIGSMYEQGNDYDFTLSMVYFMQMFKQIAATSLELGDDKRLCANFMSEALQTVYKALTGQEHDLELPEDLQQSYSDNAIQAVDILALRKSRLN